MHKDLNATKRGYQEMKAEWGRLDIALCILPNKDNTAALDAAVADQVE